MFLHGERHEWIQVTDLASGFLTFVESQLKHQEDTVAESNTALTFQDSTQGHWDKYAESDTEAQKILQTHKKSTNAGPFTGYKYPGQTLKRAHNWIPPCEEILTTSVSGRR